MVLPLHTREEVFSLRHVPSWLMLAFAAGCVNAIAVVACGLYVTHVTGTVTRLGMEIARLQILADFTIVLGSFVLGAAISGCLINGRSHRGKQPLYSLPLLIVAILTAGTGIAGHFGYISDFGGNVEKASDFVFLSILSFASGLQNASVATSTGLLVRTTHLTGPATDLGIHLAELYFATGDHRRLAYQHAWLRAGKIFAFATGAAVGVTLAHKIEFLALCVPAVVIFIATAISFGLTDLEGSSVGETSPSS